MRITKKQKRSRRRKTTRVRRGGAVDQLRRDDFKDILEIIKSGNDNKKIFEKAKTFHKKYLNGIDKDGWMLYITTIYKKVKDGNRQYNYPTYIDEVIQFYSYFLPERRQKVNRYKEENLEDKNDNGFFKRREKASQREEREEKIVKWKTACASLKSFRAFLNEFISARGYGLSPTLGKNEAEKDALLGQLAERLVKVDELLETCDK